MDICGSGVSDYREQGFGRCFETPDRHEEDTLADLAELGQFLSDTVASNRHQAAELLEEANKVFSDAATLGK